MDEDDFEEPEEPSLEDQMLAPYCDVDLESSNPWRLPDWRDESYYDQTKQLSAIQWSWEFIRRSAECRALWLEMQAERTRTANPATVYSAKYFDRAVELTGTKLMGPHFDSRNEEVDSFLMDLRMPISGIRLFQPICYNDKDFHEWLDFVQRSLHVVAWTDPWSPLDPQFAEIKHLVKSWTSPSSLRLDRPSSLPIRKRGRVDKYPTYLRLLDARDQSSTYAAPWPEITRTLAKSSKIHFEPTKDSVRIVYRQALATQAAFVAEACWLGGEEG